MYIVNTAEVLEERARRNAQKSMLGFIRYTFPDYTWGWFPELLCGILDEFYQDYQAGRNPRLMVNAPPRSGKSEQVSRRFPAMLFGRTAGALDIIGSSYSADLAKRMSRDIKRIMSTDEYAEIFPEVRFPSDPVIKKVLKAQGQNARDKATDTVELWEMLKGDGSLAGGAYRAAGVEGGITGQGFDIGIIDDPVKDYKDAASKAFQQSSKFWFDTTFRTRRNPRKNGILIIQTRWHKKDLSGQILEDAAKGSGDDYRVINFPMECEKPKERITIFNKDYQTREKGEILFPERMDQEFVEGCKTNPLTWAALYQQKPKAAGGEHFKREYWEFYTHLPERFEQVIIVGDTAQKTKETNDFTCFQIWGKFDGRIYLLYLVHKRMQAPDLLDTARRIWKDHGGGTRGSVVKAHAMYIEDKVSGTGLMQDLIAGGYDRHGVKWDPIPCIPIQRNVDKATRAHDCLPFFINRRLVAPVNAPWLSSYLMEMEDFKLDMSHEFDDQVDPTMDAIDILLRSNGAIDYSGYNQPIPEPENMYGGYA